METPERLSQPDYQQELQRIAQEISVLARLPSDVEGGTTAQEIYSLVELVAEAHLVMARRDNWDLPENAEKISYMARLETLYEEGSQQTRANPVFVFLQTLRNTSNPHEYERLPIEPPEKKIYVDIVKGLIFNSNILGLTERPQLKYAVLNIILSSALFQEARRSVVSACQAFVEALLTGARISFPGQPPLEALCRSALGKSKATSAIPLLQEAADLRAKAFQELSRYFNDQGASPKDIQLLLEILQTVIFCRTDSETKKAGFRRYISLAPVWQAVSAANATLARNRIIAAMINYPACFSIDTLVAFGVLDGSLAPEALKTAHTQLINDSLSDYYSERAKKRLAVIQRLEEEDDRKKAQQIEEFIPKLSALLPGSTEKAPLEGFPIALLDQCVMQTDRTASYVLDVWVHPDDIRLSQLLVFRLTDADMERKYGVQIGLVCLQRFVDQAVPKETLTGYEADLVQKTQALYHDAKYVIEAEAEIANRYSSPARSSPMQSIKGWIVALSKNNVTHDLSFWARQRIKSAANAGRYRNP